MVPVRFRLVGLTLLSMLLSCSDSATDVTPGVSSDLARARAAIVSDVHYRLYFDIPADPAAPIEARADISFELADSGDALQLDFRAPEQAVRGLRANGVEVDHPLVNEHILVPASALRSGRNTLEIEFLAGAASLNRKPDYLYTLLVPDRARTAFPLFDQPDIKAVFELTLLLPAGWQALSNAAVVSVSDKGDRSEHRFAPSDLVSSYLFSFVAGEFQVVSREMDGRAMTMLHRETDTEKLARNLDAIFDQHAAAIAWMEDYTGIDYPFQKFDFALIPGFQYGGMEHVGAIQYRDAALLLGEDPPETELLSRAQLIAHETAHMWFGNLVTMRWFDDVWTKEVFAGFMAAKIVNPVFDNINHELNFLLWHYPWAYAVDRSEGPNPIRQLLPNLNEAGQLYGAIIYSKAPIMMRQLELIVGEQRFREGLREYLRKFSLANASWPELIAILDDKTDVDVAAWSEVWVNTPGRPHFSAEPGESGAPQLRQVDPEGQGRLWPQQFDVLALSVGEQSRTRLFTDSALSPLPDSYPAVVDAAYLFSADGYGYGLFPTDMGLLQSWHSLDEVARGAALINAWENLLQGGVSDIEGYFGLLLDVVQTEENQLLVELALRQMRFTWYSLLSRQERARQRALLERTLWDKTLSRADGGRTRLFFRAFAGLASSRVAVDKLYAVWLGELSIDKLNLEERDRIELAEILALRLPDRATEIIATQLANTANPDRRRRLEFIAPALSPDRQERDAFFSSLADPERRQTEPWVVDALYLLHHPTRRAQSEKYLLPSLELLEEIQVTGGIFLPTDWLEATLGNCRSTSAVKTVRRFLDERPDYNAQLRMKILQAADPLFRANRIAQARSVTGKQSG